jgi:hypothetical protein
LNDPAIIVAIIALVGSMLAAIPSVLSLRGQYKQTDATTTSTLVDTAMRQNEQLREDIETLQAEMEKFKECRRVVELLVKECHAMYYQLHSNGITPVTNMAEIEEKLKGCIE